MQSIKQLEKRLQIEQDALSRAEISGNPITKAMFSQGVRDAERALHEARLALGEY